MEDAVRQWILTQQRQQQGVSDVASLATSNTTAPNAPKSREEAMCQLNYYWDMHPMAKAPTLSMVEEVKEDTEK